MFHSLITALVMRITLLRGNLRQSGAHWLGGRRSDGGAIHIGGYANEGLNNLIPGPYDVWTLNIPDPDDLEPIMGLIDQAIDANVHKGKVKLVFGQDADWHAAYLQNGFEVRNVPKGAKRHNDVLAPRALSTTLDLADIHEVNMSRFIPNYDELPEEEREKLWDGALIINRDHVYNVAVDEFEQRLNANRWVFDQGQWVKAEEPYSKYVIQAMMARTKRAILTNARVIEERGELKGNALLMSDAQIIAMFGESYDVVVPEGSWKKGISLQGGECFITMEIQEWGETAYTNDQDRLNLVPLNTDAKRMSAAKTYFAHLEQKVKDGTLLDGIANVLNHQAALILDENGEVNWADLSIRYNAAEWVARGLSLRSSESLLRLSAQAKGRLIRQEAPVDSRGKKKKADKVKIPQPCAWKMQVISETVARFFGYKGKIVTGTWRVWDSKKVIVVSNEDYLANYINWGGCDHDDFFRIFFITYQGVKSILAVRSPNGFGEYAVGRYHEGDVFPVWAKADGTEVTFPEVKGKLPKQLADAIADGDVTILDLVNEVEDMYTGELLTRDDVKDKLKAAANNTASAGLLVNTAILWSAVMKSHVPIGFGTLENYIDLTTQEDLAPDAAARLRFWAYYYPNYIVHETNKGIDKKLWEDRGYESMIVPTKVWKDNGFGAWISKPELWTAPDALNKMSILWARHRAAKPTINTIDSGPNAPISVQWTHVTELLEKFLKFVEAEAQKATPPVGLEELGALRFGSFGNLSGVRGTEMTAALRQFRIWQGQMRDHAKDMQRPISSEEWDSLYADLAHMITIHPHTNEPFPIVERHNRVLALALACYKWRKGYLRCQVCRAKASGTVEVRGQKIQMCLTHRREFEQNPSAVTKRIRPAEYSDNAVINRAVFRMYMDAMEFYGIAPALGWEPPYDDIWYEKDVQCRSCGKEHTFEYQHGGDYTIAAFFQEFLSRDEVCLNCFTQILEYLK